MNIDPKHPLLKQFISENTSGKKMSTKSSLTQSMVMTAEQKNLDFELKNENEKSNTKKAKKKSLKTNDNEKKLETHKNEEDHPIERDPLKLLKLF